MENTSSRRPDTEPRALGTVFLTGPGGHMYEIPREVAEQHLVTLARLRELGHLPIVPYGAGQASPSSMDDEVGGRHQVMLPSGAMGYHSEVQYGTFQAPDGAYYTGDHYHPYGTEMGFPP